MGNSADYGAAIFVDDYTYTSTCSRKLESECFFQLLRQKYVVEDRKYLHYVQNTARYSGSVLYGELLDRCAVSHVEPLISEFERTGLNYFLHLSSFMYPSISSGPVKVCSCVSNVHDCNGNYTAIEVRKGEIFAVSVVAVR